MPTKTEAAKAGKEKQIVIQGMARAYWVEAYADWLEEMQGECDDDNCGMCRDDETGECSIHDPEALEALEDGELRAVKHDYAYMKFSTSDNPLVITVNGVELRLDGVYLSRNPAGQLIVWSNVGNYSDAWRRRDGVSVKRAQAWRAQARRGSKYVGDDVSDAAKDKIADIVDAALREWQPVNEWIFAQGEVAHLDKQIERVQDEIDKLREKLVTAEADVANLHGLRQQALARLEQIKEKTDTCSHSSNVH